MRYHSGSAFRRALEDRLTRQARELAAPLARLRKMVAFERFLARLVADQPRAWLLKGGLALQWRLGDIARATKDLDVLLTAPVRDTHQALVRAALLDLEDWFRFLVQQPAPATPRTGGGLRFQVQALLDGRLFESFHADVGCGDPVVEPPDQVLAPPLLDFAGIAPVTVRCYPLTQHVAEKVHAYTRPHLSGESSRVKDLVDILLIAQTSAMEARMLRRALQATFDSRGTHSLPLELPDPSPAWAAPFRKMARDVELSADTLAPAIALARSFLGPILKGQASGAWDPAAWEWGP